MLLKPCNRCGRLIRYGGKYCAICGPIVAKAKEERRAETIKDSNKRYNAKRDPKYTKFYNSTQWRILSNKRLQDDGYRCVKCGKIANEVDHIKEIQTPEGWELRLDYNNTQSLCTVCHNAKHNRFKRKRPKDSTKS
jgi:5-methylcytosine-specific restriction protein A